MNFIPSHSTGDQERCPPQNTSRRDPHKEKTCPPSKNASFKGTRYIHVKWLTTQSQHGIKGYGKQ